MKPAFTIITAVALLGLSPLACADYWATLAGASDKIHLKKGETALIMSSDRACVVQYARQGSRPVQFEVGGSVYEEANRYHPYHNSRVLGRQKQHPIALAGPAVVSLQTSNVVSVKVLESGAAGAPQGDAPRPPAVPLPAPEAKDPPAEAALWQSLASR
jgi:hypothetical protein